MTAGGPAAIVYDTPLPIDPHSKPNPFVFIYVRWARAAIGLSGWGESHGESKKRGICNYLQAPPFMGKLS